MLFLTLRGQLHHTIVQQRRKTYRVEQAKAAEQITEGGDRIRAGGQTPGLAAKPLTSVRSVVAVCQVSSADRKFGLTINLSLQKMQIAS